MYQKVWKSLYVSKDLFSDIAKFDDFRRKKGFVTWFIYFLDLLWVRYNCDKFHHCRTRVTDFLDGDSFCSPPSILKMKTEEMKKLKIIPTTIRLRKVQLPITRFSPTKVYKHWQIGLKLSKTSSIIKF